MSVTPGSSTLVVGDEVQLTGTVTAVNGASTAVTWGTSNASIATVSAGGQVQAVAAGTATITATSAFDATKSGTASVTVNPRPAVNSVSIAPTAPGVVVGQNLTLTVTVVVVGGASTAVTWSSSNTGIVSVGNTTGTITGVAVGNANVTATSVADPTKSATVPVVVSAPPPAVLSVVVTPANPTIVVGGVLQLTPNVTVVSGASTAVTWSTSNAAVATVSPTGQVTAVAVGTATITATSVFDVTKSGSASVTINPQPAVLSVTISGAPSPAALIVGTTAQLTATVAVVGGASTAVTWTSSAPAIATASASGLITAASPGNATITATSVADVTKQTSVSIRIDAAAIVLSVTVGPATLSLSVGSNGQLTATVTVGNNASQQVVWSSSAQSVATVDQTGRVTAVAAGTANIRATAQADATRFAESVVTVQGAQFPSVAQVNATDLSTFSPASVDIARGGTVTWVFASVAHNVIFGGTQGAPTGIGDTANASVSRTFNTAGTFNYLCSIHAGMQGAVVVH